MKKNIILTDSEVEEIISFKKGLEKNLNKTFEIKSKVSNGRRSTLYNIYRYLTYIFYPFYFFINRNKYDTIICWQQFFGLFFAFYCKLFKVKKKNKLIICSLTFKEKNGKIKNLYKKFISYCLQNNYIDLIHVLSEGYANRISSEYNIPIEKFFVSPFGLDDTYEKYKNEKVEYEDYILALGRSNRDYDFLINVWKSIPQTYKLIIICDEYKRKDSIPSNVIIKNDITGALQFPYIANCKMMIIPLKDGNRCSGETVLIKAMSYNRPIVITKPSTLSEMYIEDNKNGFCLEKDVTKFTKRLIEILKDNDLLNKVAKNARKEYEQKYSRNKMGELFGKKIKEFDKL